MKKEKTLTLAVIILLAVCTHAYSQTRVGMAGDKVDIRVWMDAQFGKGKTPPFSFKLDGRHSSTFITKWKRKTETLEQGDADAVARRYSWTDPQSGLTVCCDVTGHRQDKVVEWVLGFSNGSADDSGRISEVDAADITMAFPSKDAVKLHYAEGNRISRKDYAPATITLAKGENVHFEPAGGRSSEEAFPFYNIESEGAAQGAMMAIGWTGTWRSDFEATGNGSLKVSAGMKNMDLYLKPGEKIRTPSVAFLFWSGRQMDGHNRFRRFLLEHHCRKQGVGRMLSSGFNYRDPQPFGEYSCITAEWAVAMIHRYRMFGLEPDIFWLDAGWHEGASDYANGQNWATTTGNWSVDAERFPRGMKPVADAAHEKGAKFMLWFEPERVVKGTAWAKEHPEWMLDCPEHPEGSEEASWLLFDLGNDEACDFLCKEYGDLIEANGVDWYRQDCNIKPEPYWRIHDEPGRTGMKEIRHVENLYRFWDYLLERFPDMVIDNCASGGKRLDWETIARSVPLWRSDYYHYDDPDGYQCHTYGLSYFLPVHGTGILLPDEYSFRSSLSSTLIFNWKITESGQSVIEMQDRIREYKEIRDYYLEDYYPLTGDGDLTGHDVWLAYQFNRPSDSSGIVVAFRREESTVESIEVRLQGLDPEASYLLKADGAEEGKILTGKELAEGLRLTLTKPRSSTLIRYSRI